MNRAEEMNRYHGCLLGMATGDALGTALEFRTPSNFEPIDDMVGGGPFGLAPGMWTDDTSMALCLAESLIETGGFDPEDQMRRYVRWYRGDTCRRMATVSTLETRSRKHYFTSKRRAKRMPAPRILTLLATAR